ncbi:hypothetical protein GYMLUDRAFT_171086 [Collybiopsis luxurians FD-317 M1]|uniref:Unplaced genomic scaffold GYMLUscaffold_37, whole genome shotgun sequence n=1 Tax=Collybiopsis luxurians FD-317 M1 TaxID=944289 RepID=A0A0D0CJ50_9AGAR|nr:hypothetical protein GYMLUDRAFT_171086 [Collybiopsis luxurians FD-317 M1]
MTLYTVLISLSFCYSAGLALYRLFFHPLCNFHGPVLAAVTNWYEVFYNLILGGEFVAEIERLHKVYGALFDVSSTDLHFNNRRAYHDIYSNGNTLVKEPRFYRRTLIHALESSLAFTDPQKARDRRSLLAPSFSRQAVMKLEYTVQKKVDQLVALLEKYYCSPESSVVLSIAYRCLTTDVITEYCFANSANTLSDPNFAHPVTQETRNFVKRVWIQAYFPFVVPLVARIPQKFILWLFPRFKTFVNVKVRFEQQIDNFINHPEDLTTAEHETIYHHLLLPKDPELRPSRTSLIHEAFVLVGAGSDTVGHACTVGTYFALQDHSIRSRLTEELKEAWPDKDKSLSFTVLEKLPYLTAFIKETLRMSLGGIHPSPRVVGGRTPEICGLDIPPGTIVGMSQYFMHMNPEVFSDPYTFNPDRWLVENTSEMMLDLVPFSKGPQIKSFLQSSLAWSELYLILGNIFRKLDLSLVGGNVYVCAPLQNAVNSNEISYMITIQGRRFETGRSIGLCSSVLDEVGV